MGDESRFRYRRDENSASDGRSPRLERPAAAPRSYDQRTQDARTPAQGSRADDALAELARLIGDEDPFADFNDLRTPEPEPTRQRTRAEVPPAPQVPAPPVERRFDDWQPGRRGQRTPPPGTPQHIAPSAPPAPEPPADDWADQTRGNVRQGYGSLSRRAEPRDAAPPEPAYDDQPDYDQPEYTQSHYTQAQPSRPAQRAAPATARDGRHDAHQEAEDDAGYAYSARHEQYDDYDEAYDPAYSDDGYMPPHDEDLYEAEPRRRKSRVVLLAVASVLALVVVGAGGVFAYRMMASGGSSQSASGQPPVIRAGDAPVKTAGPAPAAPSGDGQKLIYDRVAGATPGNERVVPREEQPVDVNAAAAAAAASQPAPAAATEPRKVKTLTVRADGTVVLPSASAPAPAPARQAAGTAPVAYAPNQNPLPVAAPTPTPVTTTPTTTASMAPAAAPPPAPAASGGYVVQVASQKSETDAMGSWKVLQSRYPQLLGSYQASVKRADLGERGIYYRAQVGPFPREQANELCQNLRAQGGDCLVQRN